MPSWKYRRILVYSSWALGAYMIYFGTKAYLTNASVASQLVIGGVSLISIILSAYVGAATWEDVKLWNNDEVPLDEEDTSQ